MGIAHRHVSVLARRHDDALRDCASGVAVKLMRAQIIRIKVVYNSIWVLK
jgi:hypothetical protein